MVHPSTQGFNRYSYAHNNPLLYTDPDGENPLVVVGIMAVAGAYAGGAIAAGDGGIGGADWNPFGGSDGAWNGEWWKGSISGAIVGASLGYGAAGLFGGSGTVAALQTNLGQMAAKSAGKTLLTAVSSVVRGDGRGWNIWPSLAVSAAGPFVSGYWGVDAGTADFKYNALNEVIANSVYGFVDRATDPRFSGLPFGQQLGYATLGAAEGAASYWAWGGFMDELGYPPGGLSNSLLMHTTTAMPGLNESSLRFALSIVTVGNGFFGSLNVDQWYTQSTNRYHRPYAVDNVLLYILQP